MTTDKSKFYMTVNITDNTTSSQHKAIKIDELLAVTTNVPPGNNAAIIVKRQIVHEIGLDFL